MCGLAFLELATGIHFAFDLDRQGTLRACIGWPSLAAASARMPEY